MSTWSEQRKLTLLMAFHTLWASVLGWSIAKYGLGASTDSVVYLFAATNWAQGKGLVSFDGSPYWLWPPLYPLLIALVHRATGLSAFAAAHVTQFLAFFLYAYFASRLFLRIFRGDLLWAALAGLLLDIGPVVVSTFHLVGSDYIYALFIVIVAVLNGEYARTQKWTTALLMALLAALAALQRYIGFVDVAVTGAALLYWTRGNWRKRLSRALPVAFFALAPLLWLRYYQVFGEGRWREPLPFTRYFAQFTTGMLGWFVPETAIEANYPLYALALWSILSLLIIAFLSLARRYALLTPYSAPLLGYGLLYVLALFGRALQVYFNRLWGRFQLPIYLPLLLLLLLTLHALKRILAEQESGSLRTLAWSLPLSIVLAIGVLLGRTTAHRLLDARRGNIPENIYNTSAWAENRVLHYWKAHRPQGEYLLFANYPAGVALHTGHWVYPSPRKFATPYSSTVIPLSDYRTTLFAPGKETYLIWIEPNTYEHLYRPDELTPLAEIEPILSGEDGGLYRLSPR